MKNLVIFIVLQFLIFSNEILQAQWVQVKGLNGGIVGCMAIKDTNMFAATGRGIFYSPDNGTSWTRKSNGLPVGNFGVYSLAFQGPYIYAGLDGGDGLYLSTNNGTNWSQIQEVIGNVYSIAVTGSNIFVGAESGIYLSTDNGTSWKLKNKIVFNNGGSDLVVIGTNIFGSTIGSVFLSTDNGTSWTEVLTSANVLKIAASMDNIFASTDNGLFLSTNNGTNWIQVSNLNFNTLAASGTNIYGGTSGVFLSTNNGTNWTEITNNLKVNLISYINVSGDNIFVSTEDKGLFRSTNNGSDWTLVGMPILSVFCLTSSGNYVFAGTDYDGLFRSTNNGTNWTNTNKWSNE